MTMLSAWRCARNLWNESHNPCVSLLMASEGETPNTQQAAGRNGSSVNGAEVRRPRPPGPNDVQPTSGKKPPNKNPLMRPRPWWLSFLLVLLLNYLLGQLFLPERPQQRIDVPYTFFKQ